jgi:hypothetical protein
LGSWRCSRGIYVIRRSPRLYDLGPLVPGAWPQPEGARSETGGACAARGWDVERPVFRVPLPVR